jgi:hypothetical protein
MSEQAQALQEAPLSVGQHTGNIPFLRSDEDVRVILQEYFAHLKERTAHHLGYPYNLEFNAGDLKPFLE